MAVKQDVVILDAVNRTGTVIAETAIGADTTTLLITPTKNCRKLIFILTNGGADYTIDVAKGDFWAGKAMTQITMTAEKRVFVFEGAESFEWEENAAGSASDYRIKIILGAAATTTTTYLCIQLP